MLRKETRFSKHAVLRQGCFGASSHRERFDDHLRLGQGIFIGQRHVDKDPVARRRESRKPRRRAAREAQRWFAGRQIDHSHVAPGDASAKPGAERLGAGFLGGETLRVGRGPARPRIRFEPLRLGEAALNKPLAEARKRVLDAPYIAKVVAEAYDHLVTLDLPPAAVPRPSPRASW